MTTVYETFGPIEIPSEALKGTNAKTAEARAEMLATKDGDLAGRHGVFVFGLQTARGLSPLFIGTAVHGFARDVFRAEHVRAYVGSMKGYSRVKPVLLFVARPAVRGRVAEAEINGIAETLFAMASTHHRDLRVLGVEQPEWSIKGVLRSGPGRLSRGAMEMRRILGTEV